MLGKTVSELLVLPEQFLGEFLPFSENLEKILNLLVQGAGVLIHPVLLGSSLYPGCISCSAAHGERGV
jgi:hypothetical protein